MLVSRDYFNGTIFTNKVNTQNYFEILICDYSLHIWGQKFKFKM